MIQHVVRARSVEFVGVPDPLPRTVQRLQVIYKQLIYLPREEGRDTFYLFLLNENLFMCRRSVHQISFPVLTWELKTLVFTEVLIRILL